MSRPRIVTHNLASVDGRLTLAPGMSLMAGDERWTALTSGLGDSYEWVREQGFPTPLGPDDLPLRLNLMSAEQLGDGILRLRYSVVAHEPWTSD